MEEPIKPERPSIFTTPVKFLTKEDILMMPQVERDHEKALKEYHKALEAYKEVVDAARVECEVFGTGNAR